MMKLLTVCLCLFSVVSHADIILKREAFKQGQFQLEAEEPFFMGHIEVENDQDKFDGLLRCRIDGISSKNAGLVDFNDEYLGTKTSEGDSFSYQIDKKDDWYRVYKWISIFGVEMMEGKGSALGESELVARTSDGYVVQDANVLREFYVEKLAKEGRKVDMPKELYFYQYSFKSLRDRRFTLECTADAQVVDEKIFAAVLKKSLADTAITVNR